MELTESKKIPTENRHSSDFSSMSQLNPDNRLLILEPIPTENRHSSDFSSMSQLNPDNRLLILEPCGGIPGTLLLKCRKTIGDAIENNPFVISYSLKCIIVSCVCVYLGFFIENFISTGKNVEWRYGFGKAFIFLALILWCILYYKLFKRYLATLFTSIGSSPIYAKNRKYIKSTLCGIIGVLVLVFTVVDAYSYPRRLVSLLGIFFFLAVSFLFSKHPDYVRWDTIIPGIILQVLVGIMAIRWDTGRNIIEGVAENIVLFLNYGLQGAVFVYGDFLINQQAVFAFQALSTLYFISLVARVLFYLGWLQKFCFKIGGCIEFILGTTVIESVYAATVIFLGMSEAPLLCAPYIELLTASEIHSIMAAGHSTVAGTLFAAYASKGIDPRYVVTASTMAAPASLCFSKLLYPENTRTKTSTENIEELSSEDNSIVDAGCKGASAAIYVVQGIIASVVACIALIAFANSTCEWLGELIGCNGITLEWIVGKIFVPIAWVMGVIPEECHVVGSLIGIKTMANEFVAYDQLGRLKKAGQISARSEAIATFALCGFANPGALGTNIATLAALAPSQAGKINGVALRAFIAGCITTFTSAAIAGLLTQEEGIRIPTSNSTMAF